MLDTALLESARKGQRTARDLNTNQIKALKAGTRVAENLWIRVTPTRQQNWLMLGWRTASVAIWGWARIPKSSADDHGLPPTAA